jgi:DinB superfamily
MKMMIPETERAHCPICGTVTEMPVDTLAALAAGPELIAEAMRGGHPVSHTGWSPAEVAVHLADTEVVSGWRYRQILAEHEPTIQPYDQDKWATELHYDKRDIDLALEAFASARRANLELLQLLSEDDWERAYQHGEYGRLTLRQKVRHISDHDLAHLRQIRGN